MEELRTPSLTVPVCTQQAESWSIWVEDAVPSSAVPRQSWAGHGVLASFTTVPDTREGWRVAAPWQGDVRVESHGEGDAEKANKRGDDKGFQPRKGTQDPNVLINPRREVA